jgi:uncharacterized protein YbjT (DUF2867 family)
MNRTAIVIGATGLVGRSVVEQLAKAPHVDRVVTLTRRAMQTVPARVINHVVDFERLDDYASLFAGDYLFSCLGTTRKAAGSIEAQRKVDLDYQLAAARLAARGGVAHYLLVSSTSANAASANPYLKMKGELEQQVLQLPFKRISIFQPSVLIGEREHARPGEKLGGVMLQALRFIPGVRRYRPIRGDEVAAKMVEVSSAPGPSREWFRLDEVFPSRGPDR